jgi:regulator of protease activity HflC (stomatin/prohibitin superfamily)
MIQRKIKMVSIRFFKRIVVLMAVMVMASGCLMSRIVPGYAGIKVHNWGNDKGLDVEPLPVGRIIYNPFTTDIYKFPTFVQHINWDVYGRDDNSFVVNSVEGSVIEFDVAIALRFSGEAAPAIFEEFRRPPDEIVNGYVRSIVEREFIAMASTMRATEIVGEGKMRLVNHSTDAVRSELEPKGISVDFITITGEMRLDEQVTRSINAVLTAAQQAIEARNRVVQAEAEADQKIARARGDSLSMVIDAGGRAEANRQLNQSLTAQLIEYEKIKAWNGVLPQVTGGATPILDFRP